MKRFFAIASVVISIAACNPNSGQSGVDDDGIKTVDSNGAFEESTPSVQAGPKTDTATGEDRVDISTRDSAK
ncbi:MAG TPA: hypothetical protein VM935_08605 [Chitinophagaceae bacterium]|jgi:hypothetical protein|nr:hypothetical protein [Chitinophagaceae bacterium]